MNWRPPLLSTSIQPRHLWAGVVCLLGAGGFGAAASPADDPAGRSTASAPDSCVVFVERQKPLTPVESTPDGARPADEALVAVVRELAALAALPGAFEGCHGLTALRRAAAIALWQPAPIKIVVFGAAEHASDNPLARQLDALGVVFEFALPGPHEGLREKLAQATPPPDPKRAHRWQHVGTSVEKDIVLIGLGEDAIAGYKAVGVQAFRTSISRDHLALRGATDDRLLTGVVNLDAARDAWPGALGFGATGKVLRVWSVGNLRSFSFDLSLGGSSPTTKADGSVLLRLASSARSDAIGREHPFELQLPSAQKEPGGRPALTAAAEWGSRIRMSLRTAGTVKADEKSGLELRLDEMIRRFGSSMGPTVRIEIAGTKVAGSRPMLVVRAPLRSPESRDNAVAAIAGLLSLEGATTHVRAAKGMKNGWVFSGVPTPLCEQAAWCMTTSNLVAVIDLGVTLYPIDLDEALAAAVADALPPMP